MQEYSTFLHGHYFVDANFIWQIKDPIACL